jgi:hypothetical protein
MAIVIWQEFPGATLEQYDQVLEKLNLGGHSPAGNLVHTAGLAEGNLRIVDVWESEDAFNAFLGVLGPQAQAAGLTPPKVTIWPVHSILTPKGYGLGG